MAYKMLLLFTSREKRINSPPIHEYSAFKTSNDDSLVPRRSLPQSNLDSTVTCDVTKKRRVAPYKGIKESFGLWIQPCGFQIPGTKFRNPDSLSVKLGFWRESGFLELYSEFPKHTGLWIPQAKIRNPDFRLNRAKGGKSYSEV